MNGLIDRDVMISDSGASTGRVLVVDDQYASRLIIEDLLMAGGHTVLSADSGPAGLALADEFKPDVILLDVLMPGLDGFEVCRRLKSRPETALIPVVLLTSLEGRSDRLQGLAAGADDFLSKPIDEAELSLRVRSSVVRSRLQRRLHTTEAVLETIASALELKDGTTGQHCVRLADAAASFGRFLGLTAHDIEVLRWAGRLHDVGKVGVPDAVLTKPGPLSTSEWELMRKHAEFGEAMLRPLAHLAAVLPIVRHHHEWWNGMGYPDGLAGVEIPYLARVFQLADAFDALVSVRPYKGALSAPSALALMRREAGTRFDPDLFAAFREAVHEGVVQPAPELAPEELELAIA